MKHEGEQTLHHVYCNTSSLVFFCSHIMTLGVMFVQSTKGAHVKGDQTVAVGRALFPPLSHCPGSGGWCQEARGSCVSQGVDCHLLSLCSNKT